jgi:crotonobetainyl-CoA:carnitine CoA-transferase CaiB-like acyl-CoA transferase
MMVDIPNPFGRLELVATPMRFSAFDIGPRRAPPKLGEHTDAVLGEIGYSEEDIALFRREQVI